MSAQDPGSSRFASTKKVYEVKFYIDGTENTYYESTWRYIRIKNTLTSGYPNIYLEFLIDNDVVITENLYPQKEIKMDIWFANEDNKIVGKPITFQLVILEQAMPLPQKYQYNISDPKDSNKQRLQLFCVPKQGLEVLNFTVNKLWDKPMSVKNMVMDLIDYVGIQSKQIDQRNMNSTVLQQCILPPMSFRNALRYFDTLFGIYTGKLFFNMNYNGTFVMHDLRLPYDDVKPSGGIYTIHKMPMYTKTKQTYEVPAELATKTDVHYVTYDNMETFIKSNDTLIPEGTKQYHIFHPDWDLGCLDIESADSNALKYGVHPDKKDLKIDSSVLEKRIVAFADWMGEETGSGYHTRVVANTINPAYGMNGLHFKLYRKIKPHKLMQIGKPISLKVYAESEKYPDADYSGSYVVTQSIWTFSRDPVESPRDGQDQIRTEADITCVRTSQCGPASN